MSRKTEKFTEYLRAKILNREVLTQAAIGVTFLYLYTYALSYILPKGINQAFTARTAEKLILPVVILNILGLIFFYPIRKHKIWRREPASFFRAEYMFLLLLPMTPIVRYIILNYDIISALDALILLTVCSAAAYILSFIIPEIIGVSIFKNVLTALGLTLSFMLFNMPSLAADFGWHLDAKGLRIQLPIFTSFFFLLLAGRSLNKKILKAAVAVFFITSTINALITPENRYFEKSQREEETAQHSFNKNIKHRPDIFLLTYESYVENETMLQYGIDNSEQEDYLKLHGFHIYRGTYSVGQSSLSSMGRVLNIGSEPLRSAKEYRYATSGKGAVQNILKESGYKTYGIFTSDYFFRGAGAFYDYSFPEIISISHQLLYKAVIEGEFRFDTSFESADYPEYLTEKRRVLASKSDTPRLMYTHNRYPGHSQNSGRAQGNETEVFKEGLSKANQEMRADVDTAIKNNPGAIIIVCGDHGPYLTKNCTSTGRAYSMSEINRLDIQDRYGSFLAIRWPDDADIDHDKIEILQDIFPAVFGYMYDNFPIQQTRMEQITVHPYAVSGVVVRNGIIEGGIDGGKPLFDSMR